MVRIIHHPKKINIVISLDKNLDTYCKYDKVLLSGDFNLEISDIYLDLFPYQHNLKKLVEEKACFKSPHLFRSFFDKSSIPFPKPYKWLFKST